ncbi:MAG: DNA primase [Candidatus Omnitrophica bacterium]|nr:DNA primase [Candidatus Omnitrophota bacterium]
MSTRFPEHILEEVLNRLDIVELISSYIPLKKVGRNFKAVCPFHYEKTASFIVSPDKGIYHCFGCSAGGNAFNFLMRYEHLDFREAVQILAKKAGVSLPVIQTDEAGNFNREIYRANELAAEFYHRNLLKAEAASFARKYLAKRKITPETAKTFKLGFALNSWDSLLNYLRENKINLKILEKSGLLIAKEGGGFYDRFRNRIMFPIFDVKSRIIGFGGRTIEDGKDTAKYINSPETPIFIKGNNLYGFNFVKDGIRQKDAAIVVEGYLDMIMPYQEGIANIVSSSGTALTNNQVRLLKRYTKNIIVIFDADSAGEAASLRSLDLCVEEGVHVRISVLPGGLDPDSLVREKGLDALNSIIKGALGLFDYKMSFLTKRLDSKSIEGKTKIAHEMLSTINKFKDQILKSQYLRKLSQMLNIDESALLEEADKMVQSPGFNTGDNRYDFIVDSKASAVEKMILKLILKDASCVNEIKKEISLDDFQDEDIKQIISKVFQLHDQGKVAAPHQLMSFFEGAFVHQMISQLSLNEDSYCIDELCSNDKDKVLGECLKRIKLKRFKREKQTMHQKILAAQTRNDEQTVNRLIIDYNKLIKKT